MKRRPHLTASRLLLGFALLGCASFLAIPAKAAPQSILQPAAQVVPTTRILAIGHLQKPEGSSDVQSLLHVEVADTVRLYLSGKIDQWYVKQDGSGVVFLLNVQTIDEARALLTALPLGHAGLITFDLVALGPLTPLRALLSGQPE